MCFFYESDKLKATVVVKKEGESNVDKKIIGIAGNEIENAGKKLHEIPITYIPAGYVKAVQEVGGLPIILPISSPMEVAQYVSTIDKLILAGGQNVSPKLYGEENQVAEAGISDKRDEFELSLLHEAIKQKKPIFAVCRGLQLINVALGGTLQQKIVTDDKKIAHMQVPVPTTEPTHTILTKKGSILQKIYGQEAKVNSFHFQAINKISKYLTVTAWSEDGIIEGVESNHLPTKILGVQWHPDFSYRQLSQEKAIFNYVVNEL